MGVLFTHQGEHVTTVKAGTIRLQEVAEMGRVGSGGVTLEDAAGTVSVIGHKAFRVTESDCSQPKTFRGFVSDRRIRRDVGKRTEAARFIDVDLVDLNAKLAFKVLRGSDWRKRPKNDTIADRLADLLASGFLNVEDNGFVNYPDIEIDGGDLRGQRPGDVLMDMATRAGFNFFVYWDESVDETSLWFQDSNTSTDFSSTLRISNVLADLDTTTAATFLTGTTFAASEDTELRRSPAQTVSGVWMPFKKGNVYRTRAATEDNYEPRDGTAPNANVKRRSRARNIADRFLRHHKNEEDRITTTIQVPPSKVNLVRAGQRIECKFSHYAEEGYGSFTWFRVLERTVSMPVPDDDLYNIQLLLSPQEEASSGDVALVQDKHVTFETDDTLELDDPVTIGNLLVATLVKQGTSTPGMSDGSWTLIGDAMAESFYGSAQSGAIAVYAKVATSTSPEMGREGVASRIQFHVYELSGASIADVTVLDLSGQPVHDLSVTADLGTFTGTGFVAWVGAFTRQSGEAGQTITTGWASGLSEDFNNYLDPDAFGNPWVSFASGVGTDINPSVVATETIPDQLINNWGGVAVLFE